jgi:GTPase SAR1 family protein
LFYSKNSFKNIEEWVNELKNNANPDIKIFLIGNKADLENEREVTTAEAEKLKNDYEFDLFMETSAKTGFNAQELFVEAGKILYDEYVKYKKGPAIGGEHLVKKKEKKEKKKKCC